jgi:hypothetical protein
MVFYLISQHPNEEAKLIEEYKEILSGKDIEYDVSSLATFLKKYLGCK